VVKQKKNYNRQYLCTVGCVKIDEYEVCDNPLAIIIIGERKILMKKNKRIILD
jgi:hypothetical protein